MTSSNIPPPPQYPNYSNAELTESSTSKEGSVMENSVIYISDNGSPNFKSSIYTTPNQILPNLVNSFNNTYQNLPPKSPKSNYRNIINNNIVDNNFINNAQKSNLQWRPQPPIMEDTFPNDYNQNPKGFPNPNFNAKPIHPQYWMVKPKEEWEDRQDLVTTPASKTRSHPNLMNDYVNLSGAESILNEIMYNRPNRQFNQPQPNEPNKNFVFKGNQFSRDQFSPIVGATPSSPELARNGIPLYTSVGLPDHLTDPDMFSAESSRLVNLLLEENKRLRSKLRQSDSRLEAVDQLERKIHNLEMLFEELLTSQRRQRLLDLQLQQASLTNYLAKNVSQNDVGLPTCGQSVTASNESRKQSVVVTSNQSMIPSSPVTANKISTDNHVDNSILVCSKQQKTEMAKVYFEQRLFNDPDRYLIENDCSESWVEQEIHTTPIVDDLNNDENTKCVDDDFSVKLKHTIKSANITTSPQFNRVADSQSSLMNSPSESLGRKIIMSPSPCVSRNWLVHHTSASPSYRVRLSQQPSFFHVNNNTRQSNNTSKATSAMNLTSS